MKNWLKYIVGIGALLVAGCAAFFSVTGLGILFSGASVAVMVMASSLEFAKLAAATYLKQVWNKIHGFNKWYLVVAVGVLMLITSAGIFGYLSNAFQQQNIRLEQIQRETSVWDGKIKSNNIQITLLTNQLSSMDNSQNKILDNGKFNKSLLKSVDNRDKELSIIRNKISSLGDSNNIYSDKIVSIKSNNIGVEREVGGFRFVAEAFGVDLKSVVKFFILLIVIVFDPLAIALIIAFNQLILEEDIDEVDEIKKLTPTEKDLEQIEKTLLNKKFITKEDLFNKIQEENETSIEVENNNDNIEIQEDEKKK